jgi:hypothetical protein
VFRIVLFKGSFPEYIGMDVSNLYKGEDGYIGFSWYIVFYIEKQYQIYFSI